jgi:phage terminase Nu1 subunit (DNA packaging protein)
VTDKNQNLAEIARKKRHLYLIEKMQSRKPLTAQEIAELEQFEAEPLGPAVVKTMEEVARVMDVAYRTVQRWKKDGMPTTKEGFYDLDEIKAWYEQRKVDQAEDRAYWNTKILKHKATLLEMEVKKATFELMPREEVERGRIARIIAVKRSFLALPTRMAPVLAMKEPREIEAELYQAIIEIIEEFARDDDSNDTRQESLDASGEAGVETAGEDNGQPVG